MNELKVVSIDGQLVAESREVAKMIGRRHSDLMRSINSYLSILENAKMRSQDFFIKSSYKADGNTKTYDCYLLTKKGCEMIANKLTGEKGVLFTAAYVTKFNEMEKQQPKVLTDKEQLMASMKLTIEANEKLESHNERIANLEENMRIDSAQEFHLGKIGKKTVIKALGGYNSPAYKEMSNKVFARFWRDFKQHFIIPRYGDLPKKKFEEGVSFIKAWQPDTSTRLEIESLNKQQSFELERKVL